MPTRHTPRAARLPLSVSQRAVRKKKDVQRELLALRKEVRRLGVQLRSGRTNKGTDRLHAILRHASVVDLSEDAILTKTLAGRIVDWNQGAERLYGYRTSEIVGKSVKTLMPFDQRRQFDHIMRLIRRGERVKEFETLRRKKNGELIPVSLTVSPVKDETGRIIGACSIARDLSARKEIERSLAESERQMSIITNALPVFIAYVDADRRVRFVNSMYENLYGKPRSYFVGKTLRQVEGAAVYREVKSKVDAVLQGKKTSFERIARVMGKSFPLLVSYTPHRDATTKKVRGFIIHAIDISDRVRAEEELRKSRDQLAVILRGVADGITLVNTEGEFVYVNDKAVELIGYPNAKALLRQPARDVFAQFDVRDADGKRLDACKLPGRRALVGEESELLIRAKLPSGGEEHWAYYKALPVFDAHGKVQYALNIFHDVTDQKRNEDALKFLSHASNILASSLDYQTTLASVARLVVPHFADWCSIELLDTDGHMRNVAVAHIDPEKLRWAKEIGRRYAPDPHAEQGVPHVMRTGEAELYPTITDAMLRQGARNAEHLGILRTVGMRSVMIVPLTIRGKTLGAISFILAESDRRYTKQDLSLAEELAQRAALAVENSRLYLDAQEEIAERRRAEEVVRMLNNELEKRVFERTAELKAANRDLKNEIAVRVEAEMKDKANLLRIKGVIDNLPMGAVATDEHQHILHVNERFCWLFNLDVSAASLIGKPGRIISEMIRPYLKEPDRYMQMLMSAITHDVEQLDQEILLADGRILSGDFLTIAVDGASRGLVFLFRDVTHEKRIDAAKSEFMSLASHQLRTPLTTVRWALGRLNKSQSEQELSESQHSMLTAAKNATQLMAETINAMLTISRIEAGQIDVKREAVDLRKLVEDIRQESQPEFAWKEQTFVIDAPQPIEIRTDTQLLKEVLSNLIRNALKYTDEHGRVSVRLATDHDRLRVDVEDTGVGIPLHQQERVFQKFFRADNAISKEPDGTGLGLYLAAITVSLLGGSITFSSEEGQGTVFSVFLPLDSPTPL